MLPGIWSDRRARASVRGPSHEGQHGDQAMRDESDQAVWGCREGCAYLLVAGDSMDNPGERRTDWRFLLSDGRALSFAWGPPPHTHRQDEAFYILEGEITLIAGEKKVTAKAGSLAYIPAGCVHSFRAEANQTRLLNFYFPGGFEKVIKEFGVAGISRTLPPADLQQAGTSEQMQALFQRVGMSPVALPDSLRERRSL